MIRRLLIGLAALLWPALASAQMLTLGVGPGSFGPGITYSSSIGALFPQDVWVGTTTALGVTNSKTLTYSFWIAGANNGGSNPGGNTTILLNGQSGAGTGPSSSHCEVIAGTSPGICPSFDSSGVMAQFNFNNSTGSNHTTDAIKIDGVAGHTVFSSGGWHHYLMSFDAAAQVWAIYVDGVDRKADGSFVMADFANTSPDLNNSSGFALGNTSGGAAYGKWSWLADLFMAEESIVCTGAGTPFGDCAGANTIPPSKLAKFISGGKPVALGSDCSQPTGRKPEVCAVGGAAGMQTNTGSATTAWSTTAYYTGAAVYDAPYGPAGPPAHQATLKWLPQAQWVLASGSTSLTTTVMGMPIAQGDFIVLIASVVDSGTVNHNVQCPTGGATTWTQVGPAFDIYEDDSIVLCYGFAGSGETGADTFTWTNSTYRSLEYVFLDYGTTVASVDTGATGCLNTYTTSQSGCAQSISGTQSSLKTPSLTTSSANETVVSIFGNWNAGTKNMTVPTGTNGRFRVPYNGSAAQILIADKYAVSSGANVQATAPISPADTGTGFSLALVPN
jgi:hypothetical protein